MGNITSLLTGMHVTEVKLKQRLEKLEMISKEAAFPYDIYLKIERIIKNNVKENIYNRVNIDDFISELPHEYKHIIIE